MYGLSEIVEYLNLQVTMYNFTISLQYLTVGNVEDKRELSMESRIKISEIMSVLQMETYVSGAIYRLNEPMNLWTSQEMAILFPKIGWAKNSWSNGWDDRMNLH